MVGTMVLVLMGCGLQSNGVTLNHQASVEGTAMAIGLAVVAMAYAFGGSLVATSTPHHIVVFMSGARVVRSRMYIFFQVMWYASVLHPLFRHFHCRSRARVQRLQAHNGAVYDYHRFAVCAEIFFTWVFVLVVAGPTSKTTRYQQHRRLASASRLLVHLACIRYTGTSVNPARSIGPALFQGGTALTNLWIFIVGPFVGGALAALIWKVIEPAEHK
jgi:aquaporin Z